MKLAWKPIIVAFVLGVAISVFVGRWCAPFAFHRWGGRGQFQHQMLKRFTAKLKLTPDQQQRVAAILEDKRTKIDALRAEMRPKFEEIRNGTRTEIRQVLTPEQQQKFDVMDAEFDARMKRFRERFEEKNK